MLCYSDENEHAFIVVVVDVVVVVASVCCVCRLFYYYDYILCCRNVSMYICICIFRLTGLENGLLGLNSKVNAVVWAKSIADVENMDIICFGHLLFEMCTGYELPSPRPTAGHLQLDLERYPQVFEMMKMCTHLLNMHK